MDFDGVVRFVVHDATGKVAEMSDGLDGLSPWAQEAWAVEHPPGSALPPPTRAPVLDDDA
jgi:hypothetical protein